MNLTENERRLIVLGLIAYAREIEHENPDEYAECAALARRVEAQS